MMPNRQFFPPVWRTLWTRKRGEDEVVDALLPPVWRTLWTRKRGEDDSEDGCVTPRDGALDARCFFKW